MDAFKMKDELRRALLDSDLGEDASTTPPPAAARADAADARSRSANPAVDAAVGGHHAA